MSEAKNCRECSLKEKAGENVYRKARQESLRF